jgi:type II secretory pathway component PulF
MSSNTSQIPALGASGCMRIVNTVCIALNVIAFALVAYAIWFVRPRFGIMFAEQNRPLPWITDAVLQTPGWVYLIPFSVIVLALVAKEFMLRRRGARLLINTLALVFAIVCFISFIVIMFLPGDLMRGMN